MRPLRLEVRGFTSFRETAVLDFTDRRLFAITGPTGAGKSSLLDAMTWALYGQVPRVGPAALQLVTHGAKAMAVRFDFSVRGTRYRVSRQAPANLGTRLERERPGGEWEPLGDRARDVTRHVEELLGLDFATFTKTVLLPQGAFDAFLRGDERERRDILTRLLGLERYEEAGRAARNRAAGAESAATALRVQIVRLDAPAPDAIAALERDHAARAAAAESLDGRTPLLAALAEAARAALDADAAASRAAAEHAAAERAAEAARAALDAAETGRTDAEAKRDHLAGERESLGYDEAEHRRLEREADMLDQREQARAALEAAAAELAAAVEAAGRAADEATRLRAEADAAGTARHRADEARQAALDGLAAAAAASLATEHALGEAANAADDARVEAERAAADRADEARRLADLDARLRTRQQALDAASREADAASAKREAAARDSDEASARLREAEAEREVRAQALDLAQREDAAIALQRGLQPGDPCPVCGEPIGHIEPHDAPELDAAQAGLDAADAALREARAAQGKASAALAAAEADAARASEAAERATGELDATRDEAARAGVDADALAEAIEQASSAADAERTRASDAARERDRAGEAGRALGLLRASVGDALGEGDITAGKAGEPDAVRDALGAAIEVHRAAGADASTALDRAREADARARDADSNVERANDRRERADAALIAARDRLDSLGAPDTDADALRAALDAARRQAERDRELDGALAEAAQALAAAGASVEAARAALERAESASGERAAAAETAREAAAEARGRLGEAWTAAAVEGEPDAASVPALVEAHREALRAAERERDAAAQRLETARERAARAKEMEAEAERHDRDAALADALGDELRNDRYHFIAWVQREAMHILARDAGERLLTLSSGRYRLVVRDEGFWVMDRLNGDERRSVRTLSGGETFLASLALALALSERLPEIAGRGGAMSLESLFLDEGFGSLDQDSLDVAIGGLETLAGGQRLVGVISHIPEVAERLTDRVEVVKSGSTSRLVTPGADTEAGAEADREPSLAVAP